MQLHAEYIKQMEAFRIYDPMFPEQTIAYVDVPPKDVINDEEYN